ncbi:alkaline phosphatase family protein [Paludibacterium yongneupense]|uniref:alkaline phosphatase family protein n=1 Tax=Paludibacterium yongneupense TaxID=400061 RepID=UPI00042735A0|nr:alkaline phosphatase family protein [Paludibacterium yongneupense]
MANQLQSIKHIVQLMLENRSFDQMLGFLYADSQNLSPRGHDFDGLTGNESNPDNAGRPVKVFPITPDTPHAYFMPGADPGEGFLNTNIQLFSSENPPPGAVATNQGFVINFGNAIAYDQAKGYKDSIPGTRADDIMGMYTPQMLPVMSALARGYAVCDRWFASVPTQTIPNRAFASAGTSQGHLDNHVKVFTCPSIFGRLESKGLDWSIFGYNREPLTRSDFPDTLHADESHFGHFRDFQARAAAGTLAAYTFLEPAFSAAGNSQHPNYDVALGEQLLRDVYYTLRNGPGWNDTLLLITYDEHGGNFDHVVPPQSATPPDELAGEFDNFDFRRFGVRIPALLISPRIEAGTVYRAPSGEIDHTSVLKTLQQRWGLEALTARDRAAPGLGDVLTLATPRVDDPLAGIAVPRSGDAHPNLQQPSALDLVHAGRVARLPVSNEQGTFDHEPPPFDSSAQVSEYIKARTAAWKQHRSHRQSMTLAASPATTADSK